MNDQESKRVLGPVGKLDGMTEEERMAKYNKKNYPNKLRYGHGTGSISPYKKTDPRSKAYYDGPAEPGAKNEG